MSSSVLDNATSLGRVGFAVPEAGDKSAAAPQAGRGNVSPAHIRATGFSVYYNRVPAVKNVTVDIPVAEVTAIIGPSGCGKSTFLRAVNRMNDLIPGCTHGGLLALDGQDLHAPQVDVVALRRRVGMVFQKPNPFPKSIFENVAYGVRILGERNKRRLAEVVERSLVRAALWNEVRDRLADNALGLSGGQQQRLCIARALAIEPEVLLMDEPCSALDPRSTARIEDLIDQLRVAYTMVIVTHNMQQAARVSDRTAFFYEGNLVEFGPTKQVFTKPRRKQTEDYITGRFG